MRRFFDMDNPLWQALSVVTDMVILNLLTLLCCVPVITSGAAFTAMNDVVIRILRQEESGILKNYGSALPLTISAPWLTRRSFATASRLWRYWCWH